MRHIIVSICLKCSLLRWSCASLRVKVTLRVWGMMLKEPRITCRRRGMARHRGRYAMPAVIIAYVSDMTVSVLAAYRRRGDAPL